MTMELTTNSTAAMRNKHLLLVEDDEALRNLLAEELEDFGFDHLYTATDLPGALDMLHRTRMDLVLTDLRLPGGSGMDLITAGREHTPQPAIIIITAFGTIRQAVKALKLGADDFLAKPIDLEHLRLAVTRALRKQQLEQDLVRARSILQGEDDFHGMLGRSPQMLRIFEQVGQVAKASGPVLIVGESGVGKELVARAVHQESDRSEQPFIAVNCAGVPEDLLEAEFFGHAKGAFTGAKDSRPGLFVAARGGTLFLDEISEMSPNLQAKLLRALESGEVRPVGSNRTEFVDVRLIAATNSDLDAAVRAGTFREDLYFRLETFELRIPPLRERLEDLDLLAARFLERFAVQMQRDVRTISEQAWAYLHHYPFPGNVRELRNTIERAVTYCTQGTIEPQHLPPKIRKHQPSAVGQTLSDWLPTRGRRLPTLREMEQRYITYVLQQVDQNKRRAAKILGVGRRTLYRKLEQADPLHDTR